MELKQISTFVALAEYLHFGHAAEHLRIAQPHVSRRIQQLEDDLKVTLFQRNRRNVKLTEAGEVFLVEAKMLLKRAETAKERVRQSALGRRGHLSVSVIGAAMVGVLPSILGQFHKTYPDVQFSFREFGDALQLDALANGTSDIAFFHPLRHSTNAYEHIILEREPLVAVLPKTHRFAQSARIDLVDLAAEPWILFPRENNPLIYDRIMSLCHKAGFSPNVVQEIGPVHTRLGVVAAGFGVHLVHRSFQTIGYPGLVYIPTEPTADVELSAYWRTDDENPILRLFIESMRKYRASTSL